MLNSYRRAERSVWIYVRCKSSAQHSGSRVRLEPVAEGFVGHYTVGKMRVRISLRIDLFVSERVVATKACVMIVFEGTR